MGLYRTEAVVLRTHKLGEADRIVVFMTAERGKVRAVAKGVRKTKSHFGGRLESPNRVRLLLYEGRELDVVTQVETVEHFRPLREDLSRMTEAMALAEAVEQVAQDGEGNLPVYRMLVAALNTMSERPAPLLVAAFYWKLLALEGLAPVVDSCVRCGAGSDGEQVDLVALDVTEGGALCRPCQQGPAGPGGHQQGPAGPGGHQQGPAGPGGHQQGPAGPGGHQQGPAGPGGHEQGPAGPGGHRPAVSPAALAVISQILGGDLRGALVTPAGPVATEVTSLATGALETHLERRLRAVRVLGSPQRILRPLPGDAGW